MADAGVPFNMAVGPGIPNLTGGCATGGGAAVALSKRDDVAYRGPSYGDGRR